MFTVPQILRDIFTFGLGQLGDWGGLDAQIDYASKLVRSVQGMLEDCQKAVEAAHNALVAVNEELEGFKGLKIVINDTETLTSQTGREAVALLEKNQELTNQSLDVSLYLGQLASKSGLLPIQYSARGFANSLITISQLLSTSTTLPIVLLEDPESLQGTLELIAASDEDADMSLALAM